MSNFLKNKTFKSGFSLGIVLFLFAQVISFFTQVVLTIIRDYNKPSEISFHGFWEIGFPFSMYYWMFDFFRGEVSFKGLLGNLIFGIGLCFLLGLIFKFWTKDQPQKLR